MLHNTLRYWDGNAWTEQVSQMRAGGGHGGGGVSPGTGSGPAIAGPPPRWVNGVPNGVVFAVGVVITLVVVGSVAASGNGGGNLADQSSTSARLLSENSSLPAAQQAWLKAVGKAQSVASGGNEMQVVDARKERAEGMCAALGKSLAATDWVGTVDSVETVLGGDSGVLSLRVAEDVSVGTWNNGFSDVGDDTLIAPDSELWDQVANLEEGDQVQFSGTFLQDDDDCIKESSVMDVNGVETPAFIFRFSSATPYAGG
jgi:hypothetical protein